MKTMQHLLMILGILCCCQPIWGQKKQKEVPKLNLKFTNQLPERAVPDRNEVYDLHIEFSKEVSLDSSSISENFLKEKRAGDTFLGHPEPGKKAKSFDFEIRDDDPSVKPDESVELKFVNPNGAKVKKWWWTSKDNTGKHGMQFKKRANDEGFIVYEYEGKDDHQDRDKYKEDGLGVLSVLPNLWENTEGGAYVSIQPGGAATGFYTDQDLVRLEKSIYGDEALFEKLFERLGGEFFTGIQFGDPVIGEVNTTAMYTYGIYGELNLLPHTRAFLRIGQSRQKVEARLDLRTSNFEQPSAQPIDASLRTEMRSLSLGAGLNQYFGQSRVRPYLGAGVYLQHLIHSNTEVVIEDLAFPHEKQLQENNWRIVGNVGISCLLGDKLTIGLEINPGIQIREIEKRADIGGAVKAGFQF